MNYHVFNDLLENLNMGWVSQNKKGRSCKFFVEAVFYQERSIKRMQDHTKINEYIAPLNNRQLIYKHKSLDDQSRVE